MLKLRVLSVLFAFGLPATSAAFSPQDVDPANDILFFFNHGNAEFSKDDCYEPHSSRDRPKWAQQLNGQKVDGRTVRVIFECTWAKDNPRMTEPNCWDAAVCSRARQIQNRVRQYVLFAGRPAARGEKRIHPRYVFVGGHSAGAWASLLIKRVEPTLFNAVVGSAPAFHGKRRARMCRKGGTSQELEICHSEEKRKFWLGRTRFRHEQHLSHHSVAGLVFGFECDLFGWPGEWRFAGGGTGVEVVRFPPQTGPVDRCLVSSDRYYYAEVDAVPKGMPATRCKANGTSATRNGLACRTHPAAMWRKEKASIEGCDDSICKKDPHTGMGWEPEFAQFAVPKVIKYMEGALAQAVPLYSSGAALPCKFIEQFRSCPGQ